MGSIPVPRSFPQTVGDMADGFLSRFGIRKLRVGSPVLSILESAAMSDVRSTQDIFDALNSVSLDTATGQALERRAADEDIRRTGESPASGPITVTDTRFTKVATRLYQGLPAPLVGSAVLNVVDASGASWPSTGSVYVGRGTANLEGPLAYTGKSSVGSYWTLTLGVSSHTRKFHNLGESVVLAQGGNRSIPAGTIAQTPQGSSDSVQFSVLYRATIPDGEVEIQGVTVVAVAPGISGRIPAGAITGFASPPFPGATCANPSPFTNGDSIESNDELRERVRDARRSRTKGTDFAVESSVLRLQAPDENKRVVSSSLLVQEGQPSVLFIDDGAGYEERTGGVPIEVLTDGAVGGEYFFQLKQRPAAKALVKTTGTAPFNVADGAQLAVKVGGVLSTHTFSSADFASPGNADSLEVVASINAGSDLLFTARTSDDRQKVVVVAKAESSEDVEVTAPSGVDANAALLFPTGRHDTLRLYRDDRLLTKDGELASVQGKPFAAWGSLTSPATLSANVDGTGVVTYTFTDADFVSAGTNFNTLGLNSLDAWAAVLNARVPGTTTVVDSGTLVMSSNLGRLARSSVAITGGDLVTAGVFPVTSSTGRTRDYTLNRYTGRLQLAQPLSADSTLSAGSEHTRGFTESSDIAPVDLASTAHAWVAVDGATQLLSTGITPSSAFDVTKPSTGAWGARYRVTAQAGSPFSSLKRGDWVVIWDPAASWASFLGMWRVVDAAATFFEIELSDVGGTGTGFTFPSLGIAFARYAGQLQIATVTGPASNQTADSFSTAVNATLDGATAEPYHTTRVRLRTNTFAAEGDIAVITADTEGKKLSWTASSAKTSLDSHLGSVESGNLETGTPTFEQLKVTATSGPSEVDCTVVAAEALDEILVGLKNTLIVSSKDRYGNNRNFRSTLIHGNLVVATDSLTLRKSVPQHWNVEDRFYLARPFALGPEDDLGVLVDDDVNTGRFTPHMWRALRPVGTVYGTTNAYKDVGDGSVAPTFLAGGFGKDFDFDDFAVFMHARAKSHSADNAKSTLWRYKRFGLEGERVVVAHTYAKVASQSLAVTVDPLPKLAPGETHVSVVLPSGAIKTGYNLRNSTHLGYGYDAIAPLPAVTVALGFPVASGTRSVGDDVTLTLTLPSGLYAVTNHSIANGSQVWVEVVGDANFSSGLKLLTGVTATTVTYHEVGFHGAFAGTATVSFDSVGEAKISGASPSPIGVGDLVRFENFSGVASDFRDETIQITHIGPQFVQGYAERLGGTSNTLLAWSAPVGDATQVRFYPLDAAHCTATAIAASVNALTALCPVTATVLGTGAGQVLKSSRDELLVADAGYSLADGLNWVKTTTNPPDLTTDYQFEFKDGADASLATSSDWANEEVRIVPMTAENAVDWLSALAVSGLSSACEVAASDQARRVQISTLTPGSDGSVQVQGGTANSASAELVGSASSFSTFIVGSFDAASAAPVHAGQWVSLDNATTLPQTTVFQSTTSLTSLAASGNFVFTVGSPALYTQLDAFTDQTVQVERHGKFVAIVDPTGLFSSSVEGEWVYVSSPTTPSAAAINQANTGIFRIVRQTATCIWIENAGAIEEAQVTCDIKTISDGSLMPGDYVSISTNVWDVSNRGLWKVNWVGDPTASKYFTDTHKMRVDVSAHIPTVVTGPIALGSESSKVIAIQGKPTRMIKRVHALSPNQLDAALTDVKFDSVHLDTHISEAAGTVLTVLDKLAFPIDVSQGADGYGISTGLIGEATRVVYGDPRDRATYPGVIAEGRKVVISGPLVRHLRIALSIRTRTGAVKADVAKQVRAAVATLVNASDIGQPIAISSVVAAATKVQGVVSVAVVSPTYAVGSDVIPLQPFEKALVLNVDDDISVAFVDA